MKNLNRLFGVTLAVIVFAGLAVIARASLGVQPDNRACFGAPDLCVDRDGSTVVGMPVQHEVSAQIGMTVSSSVAIVSGYITLESDTGAKILTSTPSVDTTYASGRPIASGTVLILRGSSATETIAIQDDDSLAGSKVELGAASRVLALNDVLVLMYDATADRWLEISFSNLN